MLPFTDYKQKVLDKFGENSKEYLIVSMYDEVTCRDDLNLKIIQSNTDVIKDENNYLILPVDSRVNASNVLNNYKTGKNTEVSRRIFRIT